ncbi:hypothetical protein AG1IA_05757 [Rhizoctonia solani AG-1 IA]|uniref:Uncharacterized protein n=1 Tax=Thanatephorus cucumeris (strain AG1-IA) TaxID=983506 RepID=L8WQC8_THACA|nr:hypothetical protein AG1IA_05757 [Rhizoctonia solani AG-1 IA]
MDGGHVGQSEQAGNPVAARERFRSACWVTQDFDRQDRRLGVAENRTGWTNDPDE